LSAKDGRRQLKVIFPQTCNLQPADTKYRLGVLSGLCMVLLDDRDHSQTTAPASGQAGKLLVRRRPGTRRAIGPARDFHRRRFATPSAPPLRGPPPFPAHRRIATGRPAITRGSIIAQGVKWFRKRERSIFEMILDDGTARLHCRWWNLPFMENYFAVGDEVVVFGRPNHLKPRTMDHPETEVVETGEENFHSPQSNHPDPSADRRPPPAVAALAHLSRTLAKFEGQITDSAFPSPLALTPSHLSPPHPRPRHPPHSFPGRDGGH